MEQKFYESQVTVFVAKPNTRPRGVGKTMLMTNVAHTDHVDNGRKVIANYTLNFPHIFMSYEKIITFPDELYDANVLLDEIFIGANARKFMSKQNIALVEFLTQIRKRRCDVFITAQTARQIDVGVREQIDIIVEMEKTKDLNGQDIPLLFNVVVRDRHIWDPKLNVLNEFIYDARKFALQNLYDTNEIITSDGTKREGITEEVEEENKVEVNE